MVKVAQLADERALPIDGRLFAERWARSSWIIASSVGLAKQPRSQGDRDRHGQEWAEKEPSPSSSLCGDGSRQCSWSAENASGEASDAETRQEQVDLAARTGLVQWAFGRNGVHEEDSGICRCELQLLFGPLPILAGWLGRTEVQARTKAVSRRSQTMLPRLPQPQPIDWEHLAPCSLARTAVAALLLLSIRLDKRRARDLLMAWFPTLGQLSSGAFARSQRPSRVPGRQRLVIDALCPGPPAPASLPRLPESAQSRQKDPPLAPESPPTETSSWPGPRHLA